MIFITNVISILCFMAVAACLAQVNIYLGYGFILYLIPHVLVPFVTELHAQNTLKIAIEKMQQRNLQRLEDEDNEKKE